MFELPTSLSKLNECGRRYEKNAEEPADRFTLQAYRGFRASGAGAAFRSIAECLDSVPVVLSCRMKRVDSVVRKLRRGHGTQLARIEDIIGFRAVVPSLEMLHIAADRCRGALQPVRE